MAFGREPKVERSFEFEYGGEKFKATVRLDGNLKIGGDANLKLNFHVGTDGVLRLNLGADGFVGAQGELKGTIKLESKRASDPDGAYKPLMEGQASVSAYDLCWVAVFSDQGSWTVTPIGVGPS